MNDAGWAFVDVLIALAVLAIALGFVFPALDTMHRVHENRLNAVYRSAEAMDEEPWQKFR